MQVTGYITRETEKAVAFVREGGDAAKPAWIPRKKIASLTEADALDRRLNDGRVDRRGIPYTLDVCDSFAEKIGL